MCSQVRLLLLFKNVHSPFLILNLRTFRVLFERCKKERRILITTSKTLLKRKECPPGTYLVNPRTVKDLQAALVHLLRLHSITLQPRKFLTRCVVCNGIIKGVHNPEDKRTIFQEFGFPGFGEDLDVYKCSKCGQGYWWSDAPQSSASRVKDSAANLLRICVRGGVPTEGSLNFFDFVDVEKERKAGIAERMEAGDDAKLSGGVDEVMEWLRTEKLGHDFQLRSAYTTSTNEEGDSCDIGSGELYPFTNVTSDFVGALDYIFFEESKFHQRGRLFIPTDFRTLNPKQLVNGHLLPSNVWPSDHLSIGVKLTLCANNEEEMGEKQVMKEVIVENSEHTENKEGLKDSSEVAIDPVKAMMQQLYPRNPNHPEDCNQSCCVPPTLSLFQMAELRKKAKLKAKKSLFMKKKPKKGSK